MYLRKLRKEDAPFMLEWMHDKEIQEVFLQDFSKSTLESSERFIEGAQDLSGSAHFAICQEQDDTYLGTISLKNIDYGNKNAEYAISTRKIAQGTGIAAKATEELLKYVFE